MGQKLMAAPLWGGGWEWGGGAVKKWRRLNGFMCVFLYVYVSNQMFTRMSVSSPSPRKLAAAGLGMVAKKGQRSGQNLH